MLTVVGMHHSFHVVFRHIFCLVLPVKRCTTTILNSILQAKPPQCAIFCLVLPVKRCTTTMLNSILQAKPPQRANLWVPCSTFYVPRWNHKNSVKVHHGILSSSVGADWQHGQCRNRNLPLRAMYLVEFRRVYRRRANMQHN